jgi:hypothetical protein
VPAGLAVVDAIPLLSADCGDTYSRKQGQPIQQT